MKIILTGSSGFIGAGILERCLAHPSITSIVALSRRELPVKHAKLETIIQKDYLHYEADVLAKLKGAEACIWSLGTPTGGREVHFDYTLAAVNAFATNLASKLPHGKRFYFVHMSGGFVEQDQNKSLWFLGKERRMRGEVEMKLAEFEQEHSETWKSTSARPLAVMKSGAVLSYALPGWSITVEDLAAAVVDVALSGDGKAFMENAELRERGKRALEALR